jgi:hypothetical protein
VTITPLARRLIGRVPNGTVVPRYGSDEWDALPDQDPRRAAAIMVAAEAWRDYLSPERIAQDLLDEMADRDRELSRRVRDASWDVSRAVDWPELFASKQRAHLAVRARGEAA